MTLSQDQLEEVTEMTKVGFEISKIAIILEVDESILKTQFLDKKEFYKAYKKGQLLAELSVRKSVFDLAGRGHSEAQKSAQKYLINQVTADE
jgi:hypothetical protein